MSSKARITSEFPSSREIASRLRIPADRAAELRRQLNDLHILYPDGAVTVVEFKKAAAGSRKATAGNSRRAASTRARVVAAKKK